MPERCPECGRVAGRPSLDWNAHGLEIGDVCLRQGGAGCNEVSGKESDDSDE